MLTPAKFLHLVRRGLLGLGAVLLILLAVSFSLFRLLLPEIPELQRDIEAMASSAVGKPLKIGEMEAVWSGWGPRLVFKNVSILSPLDDDELVALQSLTVGTHILQLLSDQPLRPAWVDAEGLRLVVEQTDSGRLRLRGFDGRAGSESDFLGPLIDFLSARGKISLGRTEIVWVPTAESKLEQESAWFDLAFNSGGGKYHIELSGEPPASIGSNVELVLDAEGSMSDMVNMRGEVFARLEGFQLHSPWVQPLLAFLPLDVKAGLLENGEVSLHWDRQRTTKVTSRVKLHSMQLSMRHETPAQRDQHLVEAFEGDLSWASHQSQSQEKNALKNLAELAKRWQLSSEKATLVVAGEPILVRDFVLNSELEGRQNSEQRFSGKIGYLAWGKVFSQAQGLPFTQDVGSLLQRLGPAGSLSVNHYELNRTADTQVVWSADGAFKDLSWNTGINRPQSKGWPGVDNFSGTFQADNDVIRLMVDSEDFRLNWPWLYSTEKSIDAFKAQANVVLERNQTGVISSVNVVANDIELHKAAANAKVQANVNVRLGEVEPTGWLKLSGVVNNGTTALVKTFIPAFTPDQAHEWLDSALLAGKLNATVNIDGPLKGFPYAEQQGRFAADVELKAAALAFANNWPAIEKTNANLAFRNISLNGKASTAATLGVPVDHLRFSIPNLKKALVSVSAEATAPVPKMLSYVRQSPLLETVAPLMKGLSGKGSAKLSINLNVPVSKPDGLALSGHLNLNEARLTSSNFLDLHNIEGRFDFTRERLIGKGIQAGFHGFKSVADLDLSLTGGDMIIAADSQLDLANNQEQKDFISRFLPDWFINSMSGSTAINVDLSGINGAQPAELIKIKSTLDGLAIQGPEGFSKSAEWYAPTELVIDRSVPDGMRVKAQAAGLGGVDLWLANEDNGELRRAEFAVGRAVASLPSEDGIGVVVDVPSGELEKILDWFAKQQLDASPATGEPEAVARNLLLPDFLDYVRLRSDEFKALGITWHALNAYIRRQGDFTTLKMTSADGSGTVRVPDRIVSAKQVADLGEAARALQKRRLAEQIEIDFDYLYLPDLVRTLETEALVVESDVSPSIDPRELPVVKARIADGRYMGVRLGQVEIETQPGLSGLVMRKLHSRGGRLDIDATGRWDVYNGQHHSELKVAMSAKNWDQVLTGIDLPEVLDAKAGTMDVSLQWPGPMTQFDAKTASGGFSVDFNQGVIYQLDPGVGRILGLFSFYTLPRRLLLDFSDLANKGLTFDQIKGDFVVNEGNAWTDNLEIKARGANASIVGRAGIVAQDYDQRITVRPQLGGGTAVVGALVSGVGVGALMLVANELLGQPFDELGVLRFHLTGSWDEPLVNGEAVAVAKKAPIRDVRNVRFGKPYHRQSLEELTVPDISIRAENRDNVVTAKPIQ